MACAFCRSTPVSPCPVCEVKPVTQVLRRTPAKAPARPVVAPKVATPAIHIPCAPCVAPAPAQAVGGALATMVRDAWNAGQVGLAGMRMAGVYRDLGERDFKIKALELIDANAKARGYVVERDAKLRAALIEGMAAEWVRVHRFDPRFESGPTAVPEVLAQFPDSFRTRATNPERPALLQPKTEVEIPALVLGLVPGDLAALNSLVNSGTLTQDEGLAVKERWDAQAKATDDVIDLFVRTRKPALA